MWTYNYLCHYNIPGSHWHQRRWQNPDGSLTPAGKERYGSGNKKEKTASNSNTSNTLSSKPSTSSKATNGSSEKPTKYSNDALRYKELKKKKIHELSNDDLEFFNNRAQKEATYKKNLPPGKMEKVLKFADKISKGTKSAAEFLEYSERAIKAIDNMNKIISDDKKPAGLGNKSKSNSNSNSNSNNTKANESKKKSKIKAKVKSEPESKKESEPEVESAKDREEKRMKQFKSRYAGKSGRFATDTIK